VNEPDVAPNLCFPGKAEVAEMVAEISGKKMAADKIIDLALNDTGWEKSQLFDKSFKGYLYYKSLSIGLEAEFKACQSQISSLQSLMRYNRENDGGV